MNWTDIRTELRTARITRRMRVREVAAHLGVSNPTVTSWETGVRTPPANRLVDWAAAVGYDLLTVKREQP